MRQTFKPENIFLVHGHGGSQEIYDARSPQQTSALNPFGERTEFKRTDVPKNMYTASLFEAGLAAAPSIDYINTLRNAGSDFKVPEYNLTYYSYTKSLRALGEKLFPYFFPPGSDIEQSTLALLKMDYQMQYGVDMPERLRTHGHKHPDYQSLTEAERKRDFFLFSTPDDSISLLTTVLTGSASTKTTIGTITIVSDNMISGIIPLNELKNKRGLYKIATVLPTQFYSIPIKDWKSKLSSLSAQTYTEWKELIVCKAESLDYYNLQASVSNSNFDQYTDDTCQAERKKIRLLEEEKMIKNRKMDKVFEILNAKDPQTEKITNKAFGEAFIDLMIKNLKEVFFWSTHFATEADFLNKTLNNITYSTTSKNIIANIQQKRGTQEPVLIIFYHCRSIPTPLATGSYHNDPLTQLSNEWQQATHRPLLARSYSRSALEGNAKTQGLTNLQLATSNRLKRQTNFSTLKSMGYANKNISNAYMKAYSNVNQAKRILQQQKLNREQQIAATTQGIQQSYSPIQEQLEEAEALRLSRKVSIGGVKLKRKTRHRRRSNRKTRRHG